MLEQLSVRQIAEWEAYLRIDPLQGYKEDVRFALMAQVITNLMISAHGKKGSKMVDMNDFLIDWDFGGKAEEKQTPEQMKEILMALAASVNKKNNVKAKAK